jgi:hypothetical protein
MSSVLTRYPGRIMAMSLGLLLFTLTSLTPLLAQAPPSGDTFVSKDYPKANYGSLFALSVKQGTTTYIQFNLATVPAGTDLVAGASDGGPGTGCIR